MPRLKCAISWNEKGKGYTRRVCVAALRKEGFQEFKLDEQDFPNISNDKVAAEIRKLSKGYLHAQNKKVKGQKHPLLRAILDKDKIANLPHCSAIYKYVQDKMSKQEDLAAILLPGGDHISPWLYGAEYKSATSKVIKEMTPRRTVLELYMLQYADKNDLPILGICRGAELINVYYGGSIVQKVNDEFEHDHEQTAKRPIKRMTQDRNTYIYRAFKGKQSFIARSLHTQAIDPKDHGLRVVAKRGNVVKALEGASESGQPVLATQFHPELWIHDRWKERNNSRKGKDKMPNAVYHGHAITFDATMLDEGNQGIFKHFFADVEEGWE